MREIKFRAWDKEENRMIYSDEKLSYDAWFYLGNGTVQCLINYAYCDSFGYEHDDWQPLDNIMQYTGLKDKNGVEIYEGDVIYGTINGLFGQGYQNGIVKYREYGFVIDLKKQSWEPGIGMVGFCSFEDYEVIGNIYDNPDLLEVQNED